jgi:multiple sugar transport system substrate-binding protein
VNEDQTEVLYNSNAGVQALTLWKEIYNSLNLSSFTVDYDVAFASQRVAMSMDGPWNLPRFNNIMKNIDWAFAPLPEGPEKRATVVGGEYLVIFKQSSYPEEAWTFIKWIIRPDVQARWAMKSGYLPVRQSVRQVPEFAEYLEKHPNFKVFVDQMDVAQAQRPLDNFGLQITRHIAEAIEAATLGGMDPQETLNRSAEKSNKLLKSVQKEQ